MTRKRTSPRRRMVMETPAEPAAWKRWLFAALFILAGGAAAVWGVHDLVAWIQAVRAHAAIIETAGALLGFVPLAVGIVAIGPMMLLSDTTPRRNISAEIAMLTIMVLGAVGILLSTAGSFAVDAVMRQHEYRACEVWHGTRMSVTTWAAHDYPCLRKEP